MRRHGRCLSRTIRAIRVPDAHRASSCRTKRVSPLPGTDAASRRVEGPAGPVPRTSPSVAAIEHATLRPGRTGAGRICQSTPRRWQWAATQFAPPNAAQPPSPAICPWLRSVFPPSPHRTGSRHLVRVLTKEASLKRSHAYRSMPEAARRPLGGSRWAAWEEGALEPARRRHVGVRPAVRRRRARRAEGSAIGWSAPGRCDMARLAGPPAVDCFGEGAAAGAEERRDTRGVGVPRRPGSASRLTDGQQKVKRSPAVRRSTHAGQGEAR